MTSRTSSLSATENLSTATPFAGLLGVSKSYGPTKALNNVNFAVGSGELVALLGPNGAGKTTAVRLLLGLATPDSGSVRVFGDNPIQPLVRMRIGAMLQVAKVPETLRVKEHIDLFSSYYPKPRPLTETLNIAGLADIQNRRFGELSSGQKQRVLFALAICGDPEILLLDEPTVGLDVESRRSLWEQIRMLVKRGKAVLLTTHYLEEADSLAERVVVINKGKVIAEGTPAQIKSQTAGRKIRCSTELNVDTVRKISGVLEAGQTGNALEIHTADAERVVWELLSRDPNLKDLEVTTAGLEEAFLALTQEKSRAIA